MQYTFGYQDVSAANGMPYFDVKRLLSPRLSIAFWILDNGWLSGIVFPFNFDNRNKGGSCLIFFLLQLPQMHTPSMN